MSSPPYAAVRARASSVEAALDVAVEGLGPLRDRLEAVRQRLHAPPTLTVAGEFGSGKSSVVNALLGADLAPARPEPTTAVVTRFSAGEPPAARLTFGDGRPDASVPLERWQELCDQTHLDAAADDHELAQALTAVSVRHPSPFLREVALVDTPGFNSPHADHDERTRACLSTADLVLWVTRSTTAGTAQELASLDTARTREDSSLRPTLALVTAIDEVPPSARGAVVARFAETVGLTPESVWPFTSHPKRAAPGPLADLVADAEQAVRAFVEAEGAASLLAEAAVEVETVAAEAADTLARAADEARAGEAYVESLWSDFRTAVHRAADVIVETRARKAASQLDLALLQTARALRDATTTTARRRLVHFWTTRDSHAMDPDVLQSPMLRDALGSLVEDAFGDLLGSITTAAVHRAEATFTPELVQRSRTGLGAGSLPEGEPADWVREAFRNQGARARAERDVADEALRAAYRDGNLFALLVQAYAPGIVGGIAAAPSDRAVVDDLSGDGLAFLGAAGWVRHFRGKRSSTSRALRALRARVVRDLVAALRARAGDLDARVAVLRSPSGPAGPPRDPSLKHLAPIASALGGAISPWIHSTDDH